MTDSISTEVLDTCPCCKAGDTYHWSYANDLLLSTTDQTYEYHRCKNCHTLFLKVRPQEQEAGKMYPFDYHPYASSQGTEAPRKRSLFRRILGFPHSLLTRIKRLLNIRIERYYGRVGNGACFLDFGCGSGKFLNHMRARGCVTIGMDFSPHALAVVAKGGHRALPVSQLGWNELPLESIDFVRMNHVVEHLYHARETLTKIRDRMKAGAILHIAVPNPAGISARLFRRYWHGLDCPRHIILYSPETLESLLMECGFSVVLTMQEPLTKDHIRSWVYRFQAAGWLSGKDPNHYMGRPILQMLAALPMMIASFMGKSDRFHIIAIRESGSRRLTST